MGDNSAVVFMGLTTLCLKFPHGIRICLEDHSPVINLAG